MAYDVFISYSRKDSAVADCICSALDRAGITYFIDREGIGGGLEFPEILAQAIIECRKVLFLASANSYASKFTNNEIVYAYNKKNKNSIIPYLIDGSKMPPALEFMLAGINWRNLHDHPIESVLVNDLLKILERQPLPSPSASTYRIGDYYCENGREGIVFEVEEGGRHGKIMGLHKSEKQLPWCSRDVFFKQRSMRSPGATDCWDGMRNQSTIQEIAGWREHFPAFAWCASQGEGWYLPALDELEQMYEKVHILGPACKAHGGDDDIEWAYISSSEIDEESVRYVDLDPGLGGSGKRIKWQELYVRAVVRF